MSKVWRYGDHVDTDVIIPARYLNIADEKELAEHAMEDSKENAVYQFTKNVKFGDIIVAGKNFGCGSSREAAPIVLKVKGIKCIVAHSFARIFYRNAINIGLPVLEMGDQIDQIQPDDTLDVDTTTGTIVITNRNITLHTKPLPEFTQHIAMAGGLINYVKETGKL